jgi:hypothetical protein
MHRFRCFLLILGLSACATTQKPPPPKEPLYPTLPLQQVPDFMRGTLFEQVRFTGLDPLPVFGYSLVVNLHNTGDTRSPSFVRDYIVKQMLLRGFDSYVMGSYKNLAPDDVLRDKRVAIVMVEGRIPVGARVGQSFDVMVRALDHNNTTSLSHGDLYEADMSSLGYLEPQQASVHEQAYTPGGPVFVNPAYALTESSPGSRGAIQASLRVGTVLNGGVARFDRPIGMQLRHPQASTAEYIEQLIGERWQAPTPLGMVHGDGADVIARAENPGLVDLYVPPNYRGDWKHFLGVVSHLYLNQSSAFQEVRLRQTLQMVHQPNAPLADISLCWEAMGESVIPTIEPLISDDNPDIAFAAARAAAFLGDSAARKALVSMALDPSQPNQLQAVRVLGELPDSPEVDHMIAQLLDSDRADVRIEAYKMLVANPDSEGNEDGNQGGTEDGVSHHYAVITYNINHRFLLDVVPSGGSPMIYATGTGVPRIAVIGHHLKMRTPLTFTAMDLRLSISSGDDTKLLSMFYRDPLAPDPAQANSNNDLPEILARLGGEGPEDGQPRFDLSFGDVVAVAQQMVAQHDVYGASLDQEASRECTFEMEHPNIEPDQWSSIPNENREGRPQGDAAAAVR